MTRPIKFRAFSKVTGEWIENFLISSDGQFESWNGDMENDHRVYRPINRDSIILMQYTGLLDKNGTEIYEGDVVRVTILHDYGDDTIFVDVIKYDSKKMRYRLDSMEHMQFNLLYADYLEVIGNIHSNPELVEGSP